jgi:hypothetical protein
MLHLGFTEPHWRTLIADWDGEAARHVAMYRAAMTVHLDDPAWTALPARLAQLSPTLPGSAPAATWPAPSAGSSGSATPAPGR